jgi:hypothetical protein
MMLDPRKSPAVFSTLCAGAILVVAASLPIWPFPTSRPSQCLWGDGGVILHDLQRVIVGERSVLGTLDHYQNMLILGTLIYAAGLGFGRVLYWRFWQWDLPEQ